MDLTLLCWVHGEDVQMAFDIDISREATMGTLKRTLKNEKSVTFRDVDVNTLDLYPLLVQSDADCTTELGKWRVYGKKPLDTRQKLSQAFPETHDGEWVVIVNYCACSVLRDN
ncbi:hypothetical protein EDC04DRAFT_2579656 [Pisolithus marmoratus]|nr:hypothetical protein EDC04DRAFT_2579656 [Pisolithus marmoratus]